MNPHLVISQLEQMRKESMSNNMRSQRVAAINYSIRAVKKSRKKSESFWLGYITCAATIILFLIAFYVNSLR